MASEILEEFEHKIQGITLIPSSGGVFEVVVGDELVYSKKKTGQHVAYEEIAPAIKSLFG